jgi:WD40 repeat protein
LADSGAEQSSVSIDVAPQFLVQALAHDARTLAIGDWDGPVRLWDVTTGREGPPLDKDIAPAPTNPIWWRVTDVAFADDDHHLMVSHGGGTIRVWDWKNRTLVGQLNRPVTAPYMRLSRDGRSIQVVLSGDTCWRTFDLATGQEQGPTPNGHTGPIFGAKFSSNGQHVVSVSFDGTLRIWDTWTGRELRRMPAHGDSGATAFDISPDGRWFATANVNVTDVRLLDAQTGGGVHVLDHGPGGRVAQVAFSADSRLLATAGTHPMGGRIGRGSGNVTTRFWDVASGREIGRIEEIINLPKFSPDGRTLHGLGIVGSAYSLVAADVEARRVRRRVPLEVVPSPLSLSSDDRSLVGIARDEKKLVWMEAATGRIRFDAKLTDDECPQARTPSLSVAVSPDGRLLALGLSTIQRVFLRDARTGASLLPLRGYTIQRSNAFSPDGRFLASAGSTSTGLVWDVSDLPPPRPALQLTPADLDAAWTSLADTDARIAYQAMLRLTDVPATAVPFLHQRLRPAAAVDAARLGKLLADLDSPRFADREAATAAFAALDMRAEAALRRHLTAAPSAEVRQRVEQLLARLEGPLTESEQLREVRAVEALEQMATPAADELLKTLAAGAADARLTREAQDSDLRLSRRPVPAR